MTNMKLKTRSWKEVREQAVRSEDEPHIVRERELLEAELRLAELRKRRKASQAAVAKSLKVSQSSISQFERGADPRLSTVAGYVKALGGRLEVLAVFDDETVPIG